MKTDPAVLRAAYSIPEFCNAHRISKEFYFKLQRAGLGPRTMKIGARTLISIEAAAQWRRDCEANADAEKASVVMNGR